MERKIGETFEYEGEKLKVIKAGTACDGCYFKGKSCDNRNYDITGICGWTRKDNQPVRFIKVNEEQQEEQPQEQEEQPQKLNLCEILKDCPKRWKFWSPMLGDVKLYDIIQSAGIVRVEIENGETWEINAEGTITIGDVISPEIMLYPSREQRDWTKVKYEPKKELPKTWEEFCENYPRKKDECYIDLSCQITRFVYEFYRDKDSDKNVLPSKQAAEAHLALMQLHQLRDCYNNNWHCNWKNEYEKNAVIVRSHGELKIYAEWAITTFLTFKSMELAKEFLINFRDLIEQAGDLI